MINDLPTRFLTWSQPRFKSKRGCFPSKCTYMESLPWLSQVVRTLCHWSWEQYCHPGPSINVLLNGRAVDTIAAGHDFTILQKGWI